MEFAIASQCPHKLMLIIILKIKRFMSEVEGELDTK